VEFSSKITSVIIKDKKSILPDYTITSMFIKHIAKPDHSEFVIYPSRIAESDYPVRR
jgi:hypothetical protein